MAVLPGSGDVQKTLGSPMLLVYIYIYGRWRRLLAGHSSNLVKAVLAGRSRIQKVHLLAFHAFRYHILALEKKKSHPLTSDDESVRGQCEGQGLGQSPGLES